MVALQAKVGRAFAPNTFFSSSLLAVCYAFPAAASSLSSSSCGTNTRPVLAL